MKGQRWRPSHGEEWSPEGFWASYSDLMAGILGVFALASLYMGYSALKVTAAMEEWSAVNETICEELKDIPGLTCQGGAVVFLMNEEWFDFNATDLKEGGKKTLRQAIPVYLQKITERPEFWKRVEVIEVGGHADRRVQSGRRGANVWIASARANEVMEFLLTDAALRPYQEMLLERGSVNGYGDSRIPPACNERPEFTVTGECADARRVEIRSTPRHQDVLEDLMRILKSTTPTSSLQRSAPHPDVNQ